MNGPHMPPVTKRWARLGPNKASTLFHVPKAGLCLSSFVVVRRGDAVLLGRPKTDRAWPERGGFPLDRAKDLEADGSWLLPATHLLMEESPHDAAKRIARDWAGLRGTPRFVAVQSHLRPGRRWDSKHEGNHWDVCFVYELKVRRGPTPMPWWSEMRFIPARTLPTMKVGRGHLDVLEEAGYFRPRRAKR